MAFFLLFLPFFVFFNSQEHVYYKKIQCCVYVYHSEERRAPTSVKCACYIAIASVGLHERMQCKSSHGCHICSWLFLWVFIKLPLSKKIWMEFQKGVKRVLEIIQLIIEIISQTSVCWIHPYCTFDTQHLSVL